MTDFDKMRRVLGAGEIACPKCAKPILSSPGADLLCLHCGADVPAVDAPPADVRPGSKLGRYRLIREIARGGMGTVYEAEDPGLRRRVAIKLIKEEWSDAESVRRLHREAAVAARLAHPNIIAVHEVGSVRTGEGPVHYIVMDFIEGGTLCDVRSDTPRGERVRLLEDVARAVGFAHQHGVIHRDLKPGNVLVDRGRVVLTDFGLARDGSFRTRLTLTGHLMGTPQYMAPEQIVTGLVDARADVYALGVMLYEILTGRVPFDSDQPMLILHKILNEDPPIPEGPRDLVVICLKAMDKDAGRRYADGVAFAEDLRRWRAGEPITARPPSFVRRMWRTLRRRRVGLAGAVAVLAVAMAAWLYVARQKEASGWVAEADRRFRDGDFVGAKEFYDRARSRVPIPEDRYRACAAQLEAAEKKNKEDEVLQPLLPRLGELPDTPEGRKRAVELLDGFLQRFPESWRGWMRRGDLNRPAEALEDYRKALAIHPSLSMAHYRRGRILLEHFDRKEEALAEYRKAQEADPENEFALLGQAGVAWVDQRLEDVILLCRRVGPHLDEAVFLEASARLQLGDPEAAVAGYTALIDRRPTAAALYGRAFALYLREKTEEARKDLDASLRIDPEAPLALNLRGALRREKGDLDSAIADFTEAIRLHPRLAEAYANRGVAWFERGDTKAAMADLAEAIRIDPRCDDAFATLGVIHSRSGEWELATADFTRAIEIDATKPDVWHHRALAWLQRGNPARAMEDLSQSIRLRPDPRAYVDRGNLHGDRKEYAEAEADYAEALRLDSEYSAAYYNRGLMSHRRGEFRRAIADYDEAIRRDRGFFEAVFDRAKALDSLGEWKEALAGYGRAVELRPGDPEPYVNRSAVRRELGDREGQIADLEKALEVAPKDWPDRGGIERALHKLKGGSR